MLSPAPCQRCSSCSLPPLLLPCRRNLAQRPKRSDGSVRASTARRRVGDALFIIVAHLFLWSGSFHWPLAPGVAVAAPPVPACGHWPSGRGWGCCSVEVRVRVQIAGGSLVWDRHVYCPVYCLALVLFLLLHPYLYNTTTTSKHC